MFLSFLNSRLNFNVNASLPSWVFKSVLFEFLAVPLCLFPAIKLLLVASSISPASYSSTESLFDVTLPVSALPLVALPCRFSSFPSSGWCISLCSLLSVVVVRLPADSDTSLHVCHVSTDGPSRKCCDVSEGDSTGKYISLSGSISISIHVADWMQTNPWWL